MCQDRTETNRHGEIKLAANLTAVQEVRKRQKLSPEDIIYALEMTIACAISYWITTSGLIAFVGKSSDFLGGMWAVVATVFVFRDTRINSLSAGLARFIATWFGFALCLFYLLLFPFRVLGRAVLMAPAPW